MEESLTQLKLSNNSPLVELKIIANNMNSYMHIILQTIKKWIFWSYDRKSWQYDLLCLLLILAIIFIPVKGPQRITTKNKTITKESYIISKRKAGENLYSIHIKAKYSPSTNKDELDNVKAAIKQLVKEKKNIRQIIPIIEKNGEIKGFYIFIEEKDKE